MKVRWTPCLTGLLLLCSLCFRTGVAQARSKDARLVFLHVTVINPGASPVEPDRAVTISGDHITAVSELCKFSAPQPRPDYRWNRAVPDPRLVGHACSRGFWGLVPGRPRYHPASFRG